MKRQRVQEKKKKKKRKKLIRMVASFSKLGPQIIRK
jgi:hypothetical protein